MMIEKQENMAAVELLDVAKAREDAVNSAITESPNGLDKVSMEALVGQMVRKLESVSHAQAAPELSEAALENAFAANGLIFRRDPVGKGSELAARPILDALRGVFAQLITQYGPAILNQLLPLLLQLLLGKAPVAAASEGEAKPAG